MESENYICVVCFLPYDADNRIPRILVNCGHTICACCLIEILKSPQLRRCPYDNVEFKRPQKCLENFPVNFAVLGSLENKNRNICKVHGEKLVLFCLQDKVKICYPCALFGEHNGHSMKMISDLKTQGVKTKKNLERSLKKFEDGQLEKDREVDVLKMEFLSKIGNRFEEILGLVREKKLEFTEKMESLFERNEERSNGLLLKGEVKKALEEIDHAYHQEENLAVLNEDFGSMISSLQPQDVKEEALKFSNKGRNMMDSMEVFFTNEVKSIKSFEFQEVTKQNGPENCVEMKQVPAPPVFFKTKTLFTGEVCDTCLYIRSKNSNPVDLTVDLKEPDKIKKISIELDKSLSFYQGSVDFNFLSQILTRFNNYISHAVSFTPKDLTDNRALALLNILFCRIEKLVDIEISFEQCEITNQPITFFCTDILVKAVSLRNLTLKLGSTMVSDISLFALAKSLLSKNLESFTLGAGSTAIADNGIEKISQVLLGVKVLNLNLKGALVTDQSLKVLGNQMMPCMKNLEKFALNCSETKITLEGVNAIFTGIPKDLRYFMFDFERILSDEVVSLFEEKVCPKLGLVEEVYLKLGRSDLEAKVAKLLENVRKERKLNEGNSC